MKTISEINIPAASRDAVPIVCGTDLSIRDDATLEVAAAWARSVSAPLVLVHAIEIPRAVRRDARIASWLVTRRQRSVRAVAERLRAEGVPTTWQVRVGGPSQVLATTAAAVRARLTIVRSLRRGNWERWLGESVASDTTARATTPTLVLRGEEPMGAWLREERPLKVFMCVDDTMSCEGALRWIQQVGVVGPIEVVLGRVGERDAGAVVRDVLGEVPVRRRIEPGGFRVVTKLLEMAMDERADLIVVGADRRRGWKRLLRRSISGALVARSEVSVMVVPESVAGRIPVDDYARESGFDAQGQSLPEMAAVPEPALTAVASG